MLISFNPSMTKQDLSSSKSNGSDWKILKALNSKSAPAQAPVAGSGIGLAAFIGLLFWATLGYYILA